MSDQKINLTEQIKQLREQMFKIEIEVLDGGQLPSKAHSTDAGFDVYATEDITLYPGQIVKHPLNIKMKLPKGAWAQIETKSGLGSKGQLVFAGVIDENYRGIPHVIMTNLNWGSKVFVDENGQTQLALNPTPIILKKGQKIAQFTLNPHSNEFFVVQVDTVDDNTDRGAGGFGSTGI